MNKNWLVFTDLDGTLLNHHDYSHAAAQSALDRLSSLGIPVILNSSKTVQELDFIARDLNLDSPRIAENGSVISYPKTGEKKVFGASYSSICESLDQLRKSHNYNFEGFHDWSAEKIAGITGLSIEAATRAGQREATEPLLWHDDEALLDDFRGQLSALDLSLKRGGRFWHVMGNTDKVHAMRYLSGSEEKSEKSLVIALGDGPNDRDMLAAADIAVIVYNPDGVGPELPESSVQRQIHTQLAGPEGWNAAIQALLDE